MSRFAFMRPLIVLVSCILLIGALSPLTTFAASLTQMNSGSANTAAQATDTCEHPFFLPWVCWSSNTAAEKTDIPPVEKTDTPPVKIVNRCGTIYPSTVTFPAGVTNGLEGRQQIVPLKKGQKIKGSATVTGDDATHEQEALSIYADGQPFTTIVFANTGKQSFQSGTPTIRS